MTNTLLRLASCLAVLISGCGGGQDAPQDAHPNHVWQGSAANLQLDMFYSAANAVLSDVPLASFNYQVVPTPNVAIENWLPTLVTLPAQRARCVPEGPVHVLSVYEGNVLQYYVDENHAACALAGMPAKAQPIASRDMQTLQNLLASYEQAQAQREAEAAARVEACNATVPTLTQGVYGCFYTATDVVMPYQVIKDVRPHVNVAVFAASAPLDSGAAPVARTTSNAGGYFELALPNGRYHLCTGDSQPSTSACEAITIDTGQLLRRSYSPGSPPAGSPST